VKIHSNYVVRTSAGQKVGNERTGLGNPLAIPNLGLESRWLGCGLSRETIDDGAAVRTMVFLKVAVLV